MTAVLLERVIRILIVDDNVLERGALRFVLERFPNIKVVGEVGDGYSAIDMVMDLQPDIALMDISLPVLDGIEATRIISSQFPETKVVVLTMHNDQAYAHTALHAGACKLLTKDCGRENLIDAIKDCSSAPSRAVGHSTH